jgi:predicted RNA polymerase sigma factor
VDQELADFCHAEYRRLVGSLSLYCRDRHLAEELAQDALLRVVSNWGTVRRLGSPSGARRASASNSGVTGVVTAPP